MPRTLTLRLALAWRSRGDTPCCTRGRHRRDVAITKWEASLRLRAW